MIDDLNPSVSYSKDSEMILTDEAVVWLPGIDIRRPSSEDATDRVRIGT